MIITDSYCREVHERYLPGSVPIEWNWESPKPSSNHRKYSAQNDAELDRIFRSEINNKLQTEDEWFAFVICHAHEELVLWLVSSSASYEEGIWMNDFSGIH